MNTIKSLNEEGTTYWQGLSLSYRSDVVKVWDTPESFFPTARVYATVGKNHWLGLDKSVVS